jgi:hypothetical protein
MAFGNPPTGMIADPERHARDSQLATWGTAARSAVADRVPNFRSRWVFLVTPDSRRSTREIWTLFRWAIGRSGNCTDRAS